MASNSKASLQGQIAAKRAVGGTSRFLNSTSASSSRVVALTPVASSSKTRPAPDTKTARPAPQPPVRNAAGNASSAKQAKDVGGRPTGDVNLRGSTSASRSLARNANPSALSKNSVIKEAWPATSATVTQDPSRSLMAPDFLQEAAQAQSWLFMTATLEKSYAASKSKAGAALGSRKTALFAEEAEISDSRTRLEAEQLLQLYEEMSDSKLSTSVAGLVRRFLEHEDEYTRVLSEVLKLPHQPANEHCDITQYDVVMDCIDSLLEEADLLEASITSMVPEHDNEDPPSRDCRLFPALLALQPILRVRGTTLDSARAAVQTSKENLRLAMRLRSLQLWA